jgi:hypothetical protein
MLSVWKSKISFIGLAPKSLNRLTSNILDKKPVFEV